METVLSMINTFCTVFVTDYALSCQWALCSPSSLILSSFPCLLDYHHLWKRFPFLQTVDINYHSHLNYLWSSNIWNIYTLSVSPEILVLMSLWYIPIDEVYTLAFASIFMQHWCWQRIKPRYSWKFLLPSISMMIITFYKRYKKPYTLFMCRAYFIFCSRVRQTEHRFSIFTYYSSMWTFQFERFSALN